MRTKNRLLVAAMVSALTLTSLTGCGGSSSSDKTSSEAGSGTSGSDSSSTSTELSGSVATDGSTSMEKVVGALSEAFMEANPDVNVSYNPTGSGSGITAVSEGRCDIGLSSRALTDDEKNQGLKETILAYDGIAVVVNTENKVEDLTVEQIADIYTGKIKNWSEVGADKGEIVLIGREAGSGTRDGFESITGTEEKCKYKQELTSTGDVITTVANNPNAIGYASLASVDESVKAISVNGVAPSEDTVKDASYKIQRPFVFVTKEDTKLSDAAQAFFDYAMGDADTITSAGVVPANDK